MPYKTNIPMSDIPDDVRELAVAWGTANGYGSDLPNKVKLGSDITELLINRQSSIKAFCVQNKLEHEMPNKNTAEYNRGFVVAMNLIINKFTK